MEDGVGAAEYRENLSKILEPLTADDEVVVLDIIIGSPLTNADLLTKKSLLIQVAFSGCNLPMAIGVMTSTMNTGVVKLLCHQSERRQKWR